MLIAKHQLEQEYEKKKTDELKRKAEESKSRGK